MRPVLAEPHQLGQEPLALACRGLGEQLLQLVDDQQQPGPGGRRPLQRPGQGRIGSAPGAATGRPAVGREPWEQAGEDQRRLARPGRPDHHHQALVGESPAEVGDLARPAEEDLGLGLAVGHHPRVRAGDPFRLGWPLVAPQVLAQAGHRARPRLLLGAVQADQELDPQRQLAGLADQRHEPAGRSHGLGVGGEQLGQLRPDVVQEGRAQDEHDHPGAGDRPLDLVRPGRAQGEVTGVRTAPSGSPRAGSR